MPLNRLNRVRRTIGFRLSLWYAVLFILNSLVLFVLAYFFLSLSILEQDREHTGFILKEFANYYETGGIDMLEKEMTLEEHAEEAETFLIRIVGGRNRTLFLNLPRKWANFDLAQLDDRTIFEDEAWIQIDILKKSAAEIVSIRLSDGALLQVGKSIREREETLGNFRKVFLKGMVPVIFLGVLGGTFLAFRALRPIRDIVNTVQAIYSGRMEARVRESGTGDELEELEKLFNRMLGKIEALVNGMRNTLDNVAHDLRTPMTRFRSMAEAALQEEGDERGCREALSECLEESDRILTMLNALMDISEAETGMMRLQLEPVNIASLLEDVVDLYHDVADEKGVVVEAGPSKEIFLVADRSRIRQVLANLLDNAVKYTPKGGRVRLEAVQQKEEVVVLVQDTGIGIPPEEIDKIWNRLYRGDRSRSQRGLGLGLCLVKAVVQAHHGRVEVSSRPGDGSLFKIYFPIGISSSRSFPPLPANLS